MDLKLSTHKRLCPQITSHGPFEQFVPPRSHKSPRVAYDLTFSRPYKQPAAKQTSLDKLPISSMQKAKKSFPFSSSANLKNKPLLMGYAFLPVDNQLARKERKSAQMASTSHLYLSTANPELLSNTSKGKRQSDTHSKLTLKTKKNKKLTLHPSTDSKAVAATLQVLPKSSISRKQIGLSGAKARGSHKQIKSNVPTQKPTRKTEVPFIWKRDTTIGGGKEDLQTAPCHPNSMDLLARTEHSQNLINQSEANSQLPQSRHNSFFKQSSGKAPKQTHKTQTCQGQQKCSKFKSFINSIAKKNYMMLNLGSRPRQQQLVQQQQPSSLLRTCKSDYLLRNNKITKSKGLATRQLVSKKSSKNSSSKKKKRKNSLKHQAMPFSSTKIIIGKKKGGDLVQKKMGVFRKKPTKVYQNKETPPKIDKELKLVTNHELDGIVSDDSELSLSTNQPNILSAQPNLNQLDKKTLGFQAKTSQQHDQDLIQYEVVRHALAKQSSPRELFKVQTQITPRIRAVLVDWLMRIASQIPVFRQILHLTVSHLDSYTCKVPIKKQKYQLVGLACLLIAFKQQVMTSSYTSFLQLLVVSCEGGFTADEILDMQEHVAVKLDFNLNPYTHCFWIDYLTVRWNEFLDKGDYLEMSGVRECARLIDWPQFSQLDNHSVSPLFRDLVSLVDCSLMHAKTVQRFSPARVVVAFMYLVLRTNLEHQIQVNIRQPGDFPQIQWNQKYLVMYQKFQQKTSPVLRDRTGFNQVFNEFLTQLVADYFELVDLIPEIKFSAGFLSCFTVGQNLGENSRELTTQTHCEGILQKVLQFL